MSRPTQYVPSAYSTLSQAQPQTIGFKPPPPPPPHLGCQVNMWTLSWTAFYGLHCVSRCQAQHHLRGSKQPPKKSARRIRGSMDDAPHRRWVCFLWSPLRQQMPGKHHLRGFKIAKKNRLAARGRCSASSLGQTPPPLVEKKLDPPLPSIHACPHNGVCMSSSITHAQQAQPCKES